MPYPGRLELPTSKAKLPHPNFSKPLSTTLEDRSAGGSTAAAGTGVACAHHQARFEGPARSARDFDLDLGRPSPPGGPRRDSRKARPLGVCERRAPRPRPRPLACEGSKSHPCFAKCADMHLHPSQPCRCLQYELVHLLNKSNQAVKGSVGRQVFSNNRRSRR